MLIFSCSGNAHKKDIEIIKRNARAISFSDNTTYDSYEKKYFKYYSFNKVKANHHFGFIKTGEFTIAAHFFIQQKHNLGTVILLHGYFDHSGVLINLINYFSDLNYNVVVYDHPGHGLSTGERATIDSFGQYSTVLNEIIRLAKSNLDGPFHSISHSMGSAIMIDYFLKKPSRRDFFQNVIFLAPMIHTANWKMSLKISRSTDKIITELPRLRRKNTHNPEYLKFSEKDPLQPEKIPIQWFREVNKWNQILNSYEPVKGEIVYIQGTADQVVEWRYNAEKIQQLFPDTEISYIPEAYHQLANESEKYRKHVFSILDKYFQ